MLGIYIIGGLVVLGAFGFAISWLGNPVEIDKEETEAVEEESPQEIKTNAAPHTKTQKEIEEENRFYGER